MTSTSAKVAEGKDTEKTREEKSHRSNMGAGKNGMLNGPKTESFRRHRDPSPNTRGSSSVRERSRERDLKTTEGDGEDEDEDEDEEKRKERRRRRKRGWDIAPEASATSSKAQGTGNKNAVKAAELLRKQIEEAQIKQQELLKAGMIPDNPKQRELYVGNLQRGISAEMVQAFFNTNDILQEYKSEGLPCLRVQLDSGGTFAFVEFRNPEVATAALAVAGQMLLGRPVKTGRPRGYVDPASGKVNDVAPANTTASDPNKKAREVYVGNITVGVTQSMLVQLFESAVGGVVGIHMNDSGKYGFIEFKTPELATKALSLNGMDLAGRNLRVGRPAGYNPSGVAPNPGIVNPGIAAPGFGMNMMRMPNLNPGLLPNPAALATFGSLGAPNLSGLNPLPPLPPSFSALINNPAVQAALIQQLLGAQANMNLAGLVGLGGMPGVVNPAAIQNLMALKPEMTAQPDSTEVVLQNMITERMLTDSREYIDCLEDIRIECETYGEVVDVQIPKFGPDRGRVFVKFTTGEAAQRAIAVTHSIYLTQNYFIGSDF